MTAETKVPNLYTFFEPDFGGKNSARNFTQDFCQKKPGKISTLNLSFSGRKSGRIWMEKKSRKIRSKLLQG